MASLTKQLNIVALVFILLLSVCGAPCTSASSLHQREKQSSSWYSDCRNGYRKLGFRNCENAASLTPVGRVAWSQSLKRALSPPPAPIQRLASHHGGAPPPPPTK
ncbi:hypothetical protein POM88_032780 [Heracleum sosnowskyi]|uniref:Uncharacterized protein n=1 Tax=Heracleum sosnowskyi TaxID=360622 RepID=A0AAD8I200_9APIA|nr:hypothetical protein POM88_032780 [Heracleum sosnowskyi]